MICVRLKPMSRKTPMSFTRLLTAANIVFITPITPPMAITTVTKADGEEELAIGPRQVVEVIGLDLREDGGFFVSGVEKILEAAGLDRAGRPQDERGIRVFAEHRADHAPLGPDFGIERRAGRLEHADHEPVAIAQA